MEESLDPTVVAASLVKPILENARVRIFEARFTPGAPTPWHKHPDNIIHLLTDASFHIKLPEGKEKDVVLRAGDTKWMDGGQHEVLNTGKDEARMLVIELK
jgi:quercetin dioxygenase-like cupin family protein